MPDTSKYRPRQFTTTALQQAKVQLTWDETDPTRTEIANRLMAGENVDDNDVRAYLASSSGEEDSPEETESKPKKGRKVGHDIYSIHLTHQCLVPTRHFKNPDG